MKSIQSWKVYRAWELKNHIFIHKNKHLGQNNIDWAKAKFLAYFRSYIYDLKIKLGLIYAKQFGKQSWTENL